MQSAKEEFKHQLKNNFKKLFPGCNLPKRNLNGSLPIIIVGILELQSAKEEFKLVFTAKFNEVKVMLQSAKEEFKHILAKAIHQFVV